MSISGGLYLAIKRGEALGCEAIQIFTKNQLQWAGKVISKEEAHQFKLTWKNSPVKKVISHASYLINLGSPEKEKYVRSISSMVDEVYRASLLGIPYVVLHPGSHSGRGEGFGLKRIVKAINSIMEETADVQVAILLETTAGQGSNIGYRFEHLAYIIEKSRYPERLGVCFDTCHVFSAGYDISTEDSYYKVWKEFDGVIGLQRLKAIHLNDSKYPRGSRKDRHTHIGKGYIGSVAFSLLVNDKRFAKLSMILETPKEEGMDAYNLWLLRSFIRDMPPRKGA